MKVFAFGLFICFLAQFSEAQAQKLNLQSTILYALDNSPNFDSIRKTRVLRDLEYKSAIAKFLPSLDFTTTDGLQNNIPFASTNSTTPVLTTNPTAPYYSSLNLGLTENLYDNGVSITQTSVANLNRDYASTNFQKNRDLLSLQVSTEYYHYSLSVALLDARKQQQQVLEKQFNLLSNQYTQGFKTKSDFLRLKTQVQRAEIERITAENAITASSAELKRIIGVSLNTTEVPEFEPMRVELNQKLKEEFPNVSPSIDNFYDSKLKKIQDEVNDKSVTLAKREYWPRISLTSGISYANDNYINSSQPFSQGKQLSWNALVNLQYNFWDWGIRKRDVAVAQINRDIQGNVLTQNVLDANAQMTSLMADLNRIHQNFKLTQELLSLEQESNRNLEQQYREGKVQYLDLITGINSVLDAKIQFFSAYFDALTGLAKYKYYEGKLYESLVEK